MSTDSLPRPRRVDYDALTLSFTPPEPCATFPPPNLDFDTTVFSRSQENILSAAQRLVSDLRREHAYTDTATFAYVVPCLPLGSLCRIPSIVSPAAQSDLRPNARSAYTSLQCGVCRQALRGEKEARAHAEQTGHTAFTEYDG